MGPIDVDIETISDGMSKLLKEYTEKREDEIINILYQKRREEVLKAESTPVGRNIYDAFAERRTDD